MAVTADGLRAYLRLPVTYGESLEIYLNAAKDKAKGAGIPEFQTNAQYDMFIYSLAAMYYENRALAFSGAYQGTAEETARKLINSFVLELRYAEDGSTEGVIKV